MNMYSKLIKNCRYAVSTISGEPLYCDTYILVERDENILWHESLFLCEMSQTEAINTVRSYASDLLSFAKMANVHGGWNAINKRIMSGYLHGELFQNRKYLKSTMNRHVETLKRYYRWLTQKGYITALPDFCWNFNHLYGKKPLQTKSNGSNLISHYIDPDTFLTILSGNFCKNKFIQKRNEILLRLGYECGLRASEVLFLDSQELENKIAHSKNKNNGLWATTSIKILGKGSVNREIYIPPSLGELIQNYILFYRSKLKNKNGPLISTASGNQIKDLAFASKVFSQAYRKSGLLREHRQGYHRLRKSFATNLVNQCYQNGKDPWVEVPRRLGHKNLETTKIYIQFEALMHKRSAILSSLAMSDEKYRSIQKLN
jgi:site-specific recombinase XerD